MNIDNLTISELIALQQIIDKKISHIDFLRSKSVPIDEISYTKLYDKRAKLIERIEDFIDEL